MKTQLYFLMDTFLFETDNEVLKNGLDIQTSSLENLQHEIYMLSQSNLGFNLKGMILTLKEDLTFLKEKFYLCCIFQCIGPVEVLIKTTYPIFSRKFPK